MLTDYHYRYYNLFQSIKKFFREKDMEPKDVSKKHFYISMFKSAFRIGGCLALLGWQSIVWFAIGFLVAEVLGILEEL